MFQVEQRQSDQPKFYIFWSTSNNDYLDVRFYNSYEKDQYFLEITSAHVDFYDYTTKKYIH
jgi:hypothetical protein